MTARVIGGPSTRFAAVTSLLLCALAGAAILYFITYHPDRGEFPVKGIDVSHHQGRIDWRRVAGDDVAFAFIKATEGGDYVDDMFAENFREARAAGLAVGAYHFFTLCRPGADQAKNFLAAVPRAERSLPPVVDIEFSGSCQRRPTTGEFETELAAFLGPVEAAFGRETIVYLIGEARNLYGGAVPSRPEWVRSLARRPTGKGWIFWQYHNKGRVDGVDGNVDLNVFNGAWQGLLELTGETS